MHPVCQGFHVRIPHVAPCTVHDSVAENENPSPHAFRLRALERIGFKRTTTFALFMWKYTAIAKTLAT